MSTEDDLEFYQSRELDERQTAAKTFDPRVKAIHLEMAGCYAKLIALSKTGTAECEPPKAQLVAQAAFISPGEQRSRHGADHR